MKRANLLRTLWIMLWSGFISGWMALVIIFKILIFGLDRDYYDAQTRKWSRRLLKIIRLSYKVYNHHHVQFHEHERYIIMSNHLSLYDIPLIFLTIPGSIRMLAKKELSRIPLISRVMNMGEFVFIDRKDRDQAIKDLEMVKKTMETGIMPWIAPEGTRSRDGKLLPFKKGGFILALQTGAKIVPVGIRGIDNVLPAGKLRVNLYGHVELYIGEPIDTTQYGMEKRDQLMQDVRTAIIDLAGLPPDA